MLLCRTGTTEYYKPFHNIAIYDKRKHIGNDLEHIVTFGNIL